MSNYNRLPLPYYINNNVYYDYKNLYIIIPIIYCFILFYIIIKN